MLNKTFSKLSIIGLLAFVAACNTMPQQEFYTRAQPESLLNLSRETVFINIAPETAEELAEWLDENQPTSAEISCASGSANCDDTADVIEQYGVDYDIVENGNDSVLLVYENISANECNNRFVSNHNNPYHMNHKGFGCSIASNMLSMVSDKRQFTNPLMVEGQSAIPASNVYNAYISREPILTTTTPTVSAN